VTFKKYLIGLLLLTSLVLIAGLVLTFLTDIKLIFSDVFVLTSCFFAISLATIFIFYRGQNKGTESQTMHILVALSLKMLLELVLALAWFFIAKKSGTGSLLLFFVLYLAFSMFSIYLMLNTLKNKSL
jgi:hypothetical protein